MFLVIHRTCILILLFTAFAAGFQPAFSHPLNACQNSIQTIQRVSLSGWLENNGGRLRLILSNNSMFEFRGTAKISLGNSDEQKEIGQVPLILPSKEISLLQITGATPSGDHYSLAVYDQRGVRLFFRIAPLRLASDPTPATNVALMPLQQPQAKIAANTSIGTGSASSQANKTDEYALLATQVQVKTRVLASNESSDSFILSFELRSQRPVLNASISISAAKLKDQKTVSIHSLAQVDFRLPESLESNTVSYEVKGKDGVVLAKGELDLNALMTEDLVTINDIRTDRQSYQPGETARLTIVTEGQSKTGYRLEVSVRDAQSQTIFNDQKIIGADETTNTFDFLVSLPSKLSAPAIFEFRIFDAESGLLFDSGEREIPVSTSKPSN